MLPELLRTGSRTLPEGQTSGGQVRLGAVMVRQNPPPLKSNPVAGCSSATLRSSCGTSSTVSSPSSSSSRLTIITLAPSFLLLFQLLPPGPSVSLPLFPFPQLLSYIPSIHPPLPACHSVAAAIRSKGEVGVQHHPGSAEGQRVGGKQPAGERSRGPKLRRIPVQGRACRQEACGHLHIHDKQRHHGEERPVEDVHRHAVPQEPGVLQQQLPAPPASVSRCQFLRGRQQAKAGGGPAPVR
eukprot:CAMPEP_0117678836 /NCGR_PEP_ID=MMETSP0804-20121206/17506_1 /TAXON_ID=1074897 /ORGANISM="Tetraselmis astigmatica, Strain CCMP880" /LENGTH=239 /DNA_ID=CAMNT_0005488243 /DNA_START=109 /DNA_END=829 /DNA_ORIENTATION=-